MQQLYVRGSSQLLGGAIRVLGCQVGGCALLKDPRRIRVTTFIGSDIRQTRSGQRGSFGIHLFELVIGFRNLIHLALSELGFSQSEISSGRAIESQRRARLLLASLEITRVRAIKRQIEPLQRALRSN